MGRYPSVLNWFFSGLSMGIMIPDFHFFGQYPSFHIRLYTEKKFEGFNAKVLDKRVRDRIWSRTVAFTFFECEHYFM